MEPLSPRPRASPAPRSSVAPVASPPLVPEAAPRFCLPHTYERAAPGAPAGERTPFQLATLPPHAAALPPAAVRHIVFVLDATGSMEPYIATAKYAVHRMMSNSGHQDAGPCGAGGDARGPMTRDAWAQPLGDAWAQPASLPTVCSLVFFRDHTDAFVTRRVGPTADVSVLMHELALMRAGGGADTPEAAAEALRAACDAVRDAGYANAPTVVVVLTDAPPHGLAGASGDNYPQGGPDGALVDIMEQCDALADLNARMVVVIAGRAAGAHGFDVNTVWRGLAARASPQDVPMVVPLEAKGHAADMLCALVTGVAASEAEDAEVVERIASLEAQLLVAQPALPEAERDVALAALLSAEGRRVTTLATDGDAAYDGDAAAALAATPSLAAARQALQDRGFGASPSAEMRCRAASSPATRLEEERSPMCAADVRRSKGKSGGAYSVRLLRAMADAMPETHAEE